MVRLPPRLHISVVCVCPNDGNLLFFTFICSQILLTRCDDPVEVSPWGSMPRVNGTYFSSHHGGQGMDAPDAHPGVIVSDPKNFSFENLLDGHLFVVESGVRAVIMQNIGHINAGVG